MNRSPPSDWSSGTFADAAAFAEIVFNCTRGATSIDALEATGARNLDGKILVDVANVFPPSTAGGDSLGERIQAAFPRTKVVKTLNTINCEVMVDPQKMPGLHTFSAATTRRRSRSSVVSSSRLDGAT